MSGITVEADTSRPAGSRVLSIKVGDAPLDDAKTYRVATNDFMARGGDGYTHVSPTPSASLPDERLAAARQRGHGLHPQLGTVRTSVAGRLVLK